MGTLLSFRCVTVVSMKVALSFCLAMLVVVTSADFSVHVEEQDRTICNFSTRNACASACSGKGCTETCISTCGIFQRPYSYLCVPWQQVLAQLLLLLLLQLLHLHHLLF